MKRMLLPLALAATLATPVLAETVTIMRETTEAELRFDRMGSESQKNPYLLAPAHRPGDTGNRISLRQRGDNHSASLSQSGRSNTLDVIQFGNGAEIDIDQTGVGKRTFVFQFTR